MYSVKKNYDIVHSRILTGTPAGMFQAENEDVKTVIKEGDRDTKIAINGLTHQLGRIADKL